MALIKKNSNTSPLIDDLEAELKGNRGPGNEANKRLQTYMNRAEEMMNQVQHLYNMYVAGVEKMPPWVRRRQLEELMVALEHLPKTTSMLRFSYQSLHARFIAQRDRWERMMRDLESGKIKKFANRK